MNKLVAVFCLCSVLFSNLPAHAQNSCFEGRDAFFTPYAYLNSNPRELQSGLKKTCYELTQPDLYKKQGVIMKAFMTASNFLGFGVMFGHGAAAFSDMDGTPEQIAYMSALNEIRQIDNPMERIRKVYYLAASHQGYYDEKTLGFRTWKNGKVLFAETPENLLNSKKKYGTAGVCREFASLLQWSLLQVARHPSSHQGGLSEKDFSSEVVTGAPGGTGHAWLRVHLPVHNANGMILGFHNFDLDTTWHPETFAVLSPRESGISTEQRWNLINQCQQIQQCIIDQDQR
ncbi:hypothetical protein [Bdellovibrio sp. HCB2-146]|uniref:hypothetical protein n=1 Tax=Bdellovibrio sp. HCB2-146 TaxID=3394362 RepID=UPI0039BD4B73